MKLNNIVNTALDSVLDKINSVMGNSFLSLKETDEPVWPWPKVMEETDTSYSFTKQAVKEGVKFFHQMRPGTHRCTVAYRPVKNSRVMYEVAIAYVHPKDQYNKKIGAALAASRFLAHNTVILPLGSKNGKYHTYYNMHAIFSKPLDQSVK